MLSILLNIILMILFSGVEELDESNQSSFLVLMFIYFGDATLG